MSDCYLLFTRLSIALMGIKATRQRTRCTAGLRSNMPQYAAATMAVLLTALAGTAMAQPTITGLSNTTGNPGSSLTITGTGFNSTAANNIVYFGATKGTVNSGSTTNLNVTVPSGASYKNVTVTNNSTHLQAWSKNAFLPTYNHTGAGTVSFSPAVSTSITDASYGSAVGDVDGDGRPDAVVCDLNASTVTIYRNTSAGVAISFDPGVVFYTGSGPISVAIGDLDRDGKLDIATADYYGGTVTVLRNTGSGSYISFATGVAYPVGYSPNCIAIGDLNNDGRADLVTANIGSNTVTVLRNSSTSGSITSGSFSTTFNLTVGYSPSSVAINDLDGNGRADLVVANSSSNTVSVIRNTSTSTAMSASTFAGRVDFYVGDNGVSVVTGDLDADGKPDIAVAKQYPNGISVLRNTSTTGSITASSFAGAVSFSISGDPAELALGDIDGEGKPDLIVTQPSINTVSVLKNVTSTGSAGIYFDAATNFTAGGDVSGLAVCDMNADAKPDIISSAISTGIFSVLQNNAPGGTCYPTYSSPGCADAINAFSIYGPSGTVISEYTPCSGTGFESRTFISGNVVAGQSYTCYMGTGAYNVNMQIWLDANDNGIFETLESLGGTNYVFGSASIGVLIPASVSAGTHTMRIVTVNWSDYFPDINPCGAYAYGSAVDYTLNVQCAPPPTTTITAPGDGNVCFGSSTVVTAGTAGGTWSTSASYIATVNATGTVFGVSPGSFNIYYELNNGCSSSYSYLAMQVIAPNSVTVTGPANVGYGATSYFTSNVAGGTWTSANSSVASVNGSGAVFGVSFGSTVLSYTATTACGVNTATRALTVVPCKPLINNPGTCGSGVTITNLHIPGVAGTVLDDNTACSGTGFEDVTSLSVSLTAGVSYAATISSGTTTYPVNVQMWIDYNNNDMFDSLEMIGGLNGFMGSGNALPLNIGAGAIAGTHRMRMLMVYPGSYSVSPMSYPLMDACGSYTFGDARDYTVTILPCAPPVTAISGPASVCAGATIVLTDTTTGGIWSSSDASATVDASGTVTGVSVGSAIISYAVSNVCGTNYATLPITVDAAPVAATIAGSATVTAGATTVWTATIPGGIWSSTDPAVATVDTAGTITGIAAGSAVIFYGVVNTCGTAWAANNITVMNATGGYCSPYFSNAPYSCSTYGIVISQFVLPGVSGTSINDATPCNGTGFIDQTALSASVYADASVVAGLYTGGYAVNAQVWIDFNDDHLFEASETVGGANGFSSYSPLTLSVPATAITGLHRMRVLLLFAAIDEGSYPNLNPCAGYSHGEARDYMVNVLPPCPLPGAGTISGATTVCTTSPIILTNSATGGTWSSSDASATIDASGIVTGVYAGNTTISYTVTNSCGTAYTTMPVTVDAPPVAGTIAGAATLTTGLVAAWTASIPGGNWYSNNPAVAIVDIYGNVSGVSAGTAIISYRISNDCGSAWATGTVTVSAAGLSYCTPTYYNASLSCSTYGMVISHFVLPGVVATSIDDNTPCNGTSYIDQTAMSATIYANSSVVTGLYIASTYDMSGQVWIDFNDNGAFDVSEAVGGVNLFNGYTPITLSIPAAAGVGAHRMRVLTSFTGFSEGAYPNLNPCGPYTYGDVRDYTINILPECPIADAGTINGPATVVSGAVSPFTATVAGGAWSSSNATIAIVDSFGSVTGVTPGAATISYGVSNACGTAYTTTTVNVVSSAATYCAPVYTSPAEACTAYDMSIVHFNLPGVGGTLIDDAVHCTGTGFTNNTLMYASVNAGSILTSNITTGGNPANVQVWVDFNDNGTFETDETVGGLNSFSGYVPFPMTITTPASASVGYHRMRVLLIWNGSGEGSYPDLNPCGTYVFGETRDYTLNILPSCLPDAGTISGSSSLCAGTTITLEETTSGGSWITGNESIATISASGMVTAVSAGNVTISYGVSNSCGVAYVTHEVSVNTPPAPGAISGSLTICAGSSALLVASATGGTWSSSNTKATVNPASGIVTGVTAGAVTISYANGCGVSATYAINVLSTPGALTGTNTLCEGAVSAFASSTTGGAWSSSDETVATVSPASPAVVSAVTAGMATITYTGINGCAATRSVTVNTVPSPMATPSPLCVGETVTLSNPVPGGVWSSTLSYKATVSPDGAVTALSAGSTTIKYSIGSCVASVPFTISTTPSAISGNVTICEGVATTFTNSTPGGTWTTSDAAIAAIDASSPVGITGLSAGNAIISYTIGSCAATRVITVNTAPAAMIAPAPVCVGESVTLANPVPGGVWSSTLSYKASVSPLGVVTAASAGSTTIKYSIGSCVSSVPFTINITPVAISGINSICEGVATTFTNSTPGGTWSTSNSGIADIDSSSPVGITGLSAGNAIITYTIGSCSATRTITVNTAPAVMATPAPICVGETVTLANPVPGGVWSSTLSYKAAVSTNGAVTGASAGSTTIKYSIGSCVASVPVIVNITPVAITGNNTICQGVVTTFSNSTPGGTWSTNDPGIAGMDTSSPVGITGLSAGNAIITYAIGSCAATRIITVNTAPAAMATPAPVCVGATVSLTNSVPGGVWTSVVPGRATVSAGGVVYAVSAGTTTIKYSIGSCITSVPFTVSTTPVAITGTTVICEGAVTTFSNSVAGGVWTTGNAAVASVSASSPVTISGISGGVATISYSIGSCTATREITINALPAAMATPAPVCIGVAVPLSNATPGGVWSTTYPTRATISASGVVQALNSGVSTIRYTVNGCVSSVPFTVSPTPTGISGLNTVCRGSSVTWTGNVAGGTWTTANALIATVNSVTTGIMTGVSTGVATITYTLGSCFVTKVLNVGNCGAKEDDAQGVTDLFGTNASVSVFPNPATSKITIKSSVPVNVKLFTADGKLVMTQADAHELAVDNLASGVYMIMIYDENNLLLKIERMVKMD